MKILSIDVGIKNLAFCLLDHHSVEKWGVVDLTEDLRQKCCFKNKGVSCTADAKFIKNDSMFCLRHAKKQVDILIPTKEMKKSHMNKLSIMDLQALADRHEIPYLPSTKKKELIDDLSNYFEKQAFSEVDNVSASDIDLVLVGKTLKEKFNSLFDDVEELERVVIENQISPIANRMKTLQGMIAQYFIMKDESIIIDFVSASNKLKLCIEDETEKVEINDLTYNQRKKLGVTRCEKIVKDNYIEWYQFFTNNRKKDDLADAFLQGKWYLTNRC